MRISDWSSDVCSSDLRVPELKELSSNEDFFPEIAFPSSFIVSDEMADDAEVIKKVNAVIKEAIDFRRENPEKSVEITASFLNVPQEPLMAASKLARLPSTPELEDLTRETGTASCRARVCPYV